MREIALFRFTPIGSIFTFSDHTCNYEQTQSLTLAVDEDGPGGYWPIRASVFEMRTISTQCEDDQPADPPYSRIVGTTYRWSASLGGYVADSDALDRYAEQSRERFQSG